ncbi:unnamed protein product [Leuciscus chuanchicus]
MIIPPTPVVAPEPQASPRGRTPARATRRLTRRRDQPSPPPARLPAASPASSYHSTVPTIPPIGKWTVAGLRQALGNSDVLTSRKMNKAELYDLYVSLQATPKTTHRQSKARRAINSPAQTAPSSFRSGHGSIRLSGRSSRPSATPGRAPNSAMAGPQPPLDDVQPSTSAYAATAHAAGPSGLPTAAQFYTPAVHNPFLFQRPPAPVADTSAMLSALASQTKQSQQFLPTGYNPAHSQWAAAPATQPSAGPPPPAVHSHSASYYPSFPQNDTHFQFSAGHPIASAPMTFAAPGYTLPSSVINNKSPFSLSTAIPMAVPSNAVAMDPPPVSQTIRAQILSEIQDAGTRGGSIPNSSSSLFRTNIPVNHPLKPLLEASLDSILQAVSPRTLQSYITAWRKLHSENKVLTSELEKVFGPGLVIKVEDSSGDSEIYSQDVTIALIAVSVVLAVISVTLALTIIHFVKKKGTDSDRQSSNTPIDLTERRHSIDHFANFNTNPEPREFQDQLSCDSHNDELRSQQT